MAYDEALARRVSAIIGARPEVTERKMFGGIAWMLAGNMACGVLGEEVLVRLDPGDADRALAEPHVRPFEMGGRTSKGFVLVGGEAIAEETGLAPWVDAGADYAASLPPK
jgi:TfoX/Sxy family transcriptional regulator of competence genes